MTKIAIIDFNPDQNPDRRQYVRRISSLIPAGIDIEGIFFREEVDFSGFDALILSGSKLSATDYQLMVQSGSVTGNDYLSVHRTAERLSQYDGPIFGICFGAQLGAYVMGGRLGKLQSTEAGYLNHYLTDDGETDTVFGHLPKIFWGAHMHTDFVDELPSEPGLESRILALRGGHIHVYSVKMPNGSVRYGVQPHPEMSNPHDATFLVRENESWLKHAIGEEDFRRALIVPPNAEYSLAQTITRFAETLR